MGQEIKFKELRQLAESASQKAYSPYSKVQVGSALESASGKIFYGCNIENSSFGATICAERVAIFNAIAQGEKEILKIYIYTKDGWPPCGCCRQVMAEFANPNLKIILGDAQGREAVYSLHDLIPMSFGPKYLDA